MYIYIYIYMYIFILPNSPESSQPCSVSPVDVVDEVEVAGPERHRRVLGGKRFDCAIVSITKKYPHFGHEN